MNTLTSLLDAIACPRILVLGDLILDRYTFGEAERISPEAPVPVLRSDASDLRLGGAASVAFLLRNLGAHVTLAGVVGEDSAGRLLVELVRDAGIDGLLVFADPQRPTTTKERFIGRTADRAASGGQQILRVDSESRDPINTDLETQFVNSILEFLSPCSSAEKRFDALLISDYAKGVCTQRLLAALIAAAVKAGLPTIVDPARGINFTRYQQATLVKPNRVEAELASGRKIGTPRDALCVGQRLCRKHAFGALLITLDREGMALVQDDDSQELYATRTRDVCDITGAGDMVLAVLGLCLASAVPLPQAAHLANIAAGLEVEKLGVAPVTRAELRVACASEQHEASHPAFSREAQPTVEVASCRFRPARPPVGPVASTASREASPHPLTHAQVSPNPKSPVLERQGPVPKSASKLTTLAALLSVRAAYRDSGKSVVFTNGCFDLLHVGHMIMIEQASALGDILIVAVNSDASARTLKGLGRPVVPEHDRAMMLASLESVDHVLIFDDPTPHNMLEQLRPEILVKGGTTAEIIGHEIVESYGGRAVHVDESPGISTTRIIAQLHQSHSPPAPQTASTLGEC